ncbi:MAG: DNA mismatch repair protein MutS [Parachlamydiales bacterium]|nr:DNA mismatch repair protein MutS [Parachlamydiales bacterium]
MNTEKSTPMMAQWNDCKKKAKDALLLFRLGDFFEAFYQDAEMISKELNLTLTKRQKIPMCGVPHHTAYTYIDRLIAKGYKVAIADQKEDPKKAKGLVLRELTHILSPATVIHSSLLDDKKNNFFVSCAQVGTIFGMCICDITTSEFQVLEVEGKNALLDELFRLQPKELLISKKFAADHKEILHSLSTPLINTIDNWNFDHTASIEALRVHFQVHSLDSFGLKGMIAAINAAGALITYLKEELHLTLSHITTIQKQFLQEYMLLDPTCIKNLEIFSSDDKNSLIHLIDYTKTPMGGRLLREWLRHPLIHPEKINARLDAVEEIIHQPSTAITHILEKISDLERIIMKITSSQLSPRDIISLKNSVENLPQLKTHLQAYSSPHIQEDERNIAPLTALHEFIEKALLDAPPLRLFDGDVFKKGYDKALDDLRDIRDHSRKWLAQYQATLREKTDLKTLKVGYTKVFGYYIEVSKGQSHKAPSYFHRRQTLVNAERFITDELKEFEEKVLSAEEKIAALELSLFNHLTHEISQYTPQIMNTAKALSRIDVLWGLARCAQINHYCRPKVDESHKLIIKKGRHPIIETSITKNTFIPNDTHLDHDHHQLFIITGPNMAGKSTYIRQIGLIVIMAHMGSFVPAQEAHIGIIDKVFSRIGASDDLTRGQSTFMVEMTETANILHNATSKSLIILDEIGRGTSTYDGISIAWAVAEYLLTVSGKKAKTLFATHYWELTELERSFSGAKNYNVAVEETSEGIIFLHKIIPGGTDKSYGIHVARLAGLPSKVLTKAEEILNRFEEDGDKKGKKQKKYSQQYLPFSTLSSKEEMILHEIEKLNLDQVTPIQALEKLLDFQQKIQHV